MKKTKYIKAVTFIEMREHWGSLAYSLNNRVLINTVMYFYVRCRKDGSVNFDTTVVYSIQELIEGTNFKLIK